MSVYSEIATRAVKTASCGCRKGMAGPDDVPYRWPEDRKAGLTYGELQQIDDWLRNYLLPPCFDARNSLARPGAWSWYASGHYAGLKNAPVGGKATNEYGETPRQLWQRIEQRWNALQLAHKHELQPAYDTIRHWKDTWPTQGKWFDWKPQKVIDHVKWWSNGGAPGGLDAWFRFVGAMALGRDLFAEKFEEIGGVQLGLQDSIEATLDSGVAVSGEWQNLAGRWVWKGYDLAGKPLLTSEPLFARPAVSPVEWATVQARNESVLRFLLEIIPAAESAAAAREATPILLQLINREGQLRRGFTPLANVPHSGLALGQLLAHLFNLLGVDVVQTMGSFGEQLADEADLKYPWRPAGSLDPS